MNVTVEELAPCKRLMRVEVDVQSVDDTFTSVTRDLQRQVRVPGFRPGKAPLDLVQRALAGRLDQEVKKRLINDAYQKAVAEKHLHPVGKVDIEEIQFGRGQALQFAATMETEPEFELPDYKKLPLRRDTRAVSDEDVDRALNLLRDERARFQDVTRPVQSGDYVVVNYDGTCEGKPITEFAPNARRLTTEKGFWLHVEPNSFIPGFTDQLLGAQAGERRTVQVQFPADFVEQPVAGKAGVYVVEILQVKEKVLAPLDDELAKSYGAPDLAKLRAGVRKDLENELTFNKKRTVRNQLVGTLVGRVSCELPDSLVEHATRNAVYDIVRTNQDRGIPSQAIQQHKDEIYTAATNSARERVKASIILRRIAEKEEIKATQEEVFYRVSVLAAQNKVRPEEMLRRLQESGGLEQIYEQIISVKVLDLLELHAEIIDVPGAS